MDRILFTSFFRANYFSFRSLLFSALALCIGASTAFTIKAEVQNDPTVWYEDFYEPNFPFFTSTVDARSFEPPQLISNSALSLSDAWIDQWSVDNLIARGVVLPVNDRWIACFDTDLLRWAIVWESPGSITKGSDFLTMQSMAQISYRNPNKKTGGGQSGLSQPVGLPLMGGKSIPGWGRVEQNRWSDPRPEGPDPREFGKGPLPQKQSRWIGIERMTEALRLSYEVEGVLIHDTTMLRNQDGWIRQLEWQGSWEFHVSHAISQIPKESELILKQLENKWVARWKRPSLNADSPQFLKLTINDVPNGVRLVYENGWLALQFKNSNSPDHGKISLNLQSDRSLKSDMSYRSDHFIIDPINLPQPNRQGRRVRVSGMDFFDNGNVAAVVTFDGDVWMVEGFLTDPSLQELHWKRFASGLHEPQSVHAEKDGVFVFTRNGLERLIDRDGDGSADIYENYCNLFAQSGETREFAMDSVRAKDGSFYLAKGGQQVSFPGIHNGTILKISPDGKSFEIFAEGLRQPFLGYNSNNDWVLASDQQGHYVPSSPVHWIQKDLFYGFGPRNRPDLFENRKIQEPPVWIPHRVVQSGAGVVWSSNTALGPLNDRVLYLDYFGPGIAVVFPEIETGFTGPVWVQGAVLKAPIEIDFPLLDGCINPKTGELFVCGFQIWGSQANKLEGMARIRYERANEPTAIPENVRITQEGLWMRWNDEMDTESASNLENFAISQWNYRRTSGYGSGYFKSDGEPGREALASLAAGVSPSGKEIFIALQDLTPMDQLEFNFTLNFKNQSTTSLRPIQQTLYWTIRRLESIHDLADGLGTDLSWIQPILSQAQTGEIAATLSNSLLNPAQPSIEAGRSIYSNLGCASCHSTDGTLEGRTGPSLLGLFGKIRHFERSPDRIADRKYILDSLMNPTAEIVHGFGTSDIGMPSYKGILGENGVESVVMWIRQLQ